MQHMCLVVRRDSSGIRFDSLNCIYFSFIIIFVLFCVAEPATDEGGEKTGVTGKNPDELQKMPHIKARKFNRQLRLEPVL